MTVELRRIAFESRHELRALLDEYLLELGQYGDVNLEYPYFDAYWDPKESRWAYLLWRGGEVVGLAMVNTVSSTSKPFDFVMAEFGIVPAARRSGLGVAAAVAVFRNHPGSWQLAIMAKNAPGHAFWPRAIAAAGAGEVVCFEHDGDTIYEFVIA